MRKKERGKGNSKVSPEWKEGKKKEGKGGKNMRTD